MNIVKKYLSNHKVLWYTSNAGNWGQVWIVASWIFLFFIGNFISNFIVINVTRFNQYLAHALPIVLQILCLVFVGFYGNNYYKGEKSEIEILVAAMLFCTGLQNGLTASISNFAIKTTHLTGTTTDLGVLLSMFTQRKYRKNKALVGRAKVLAVIVVSYIAGAVFAGITYYHLQFNVFYIICICLVVVVLYDFYKIYLRHFTSTFSWFAGKNHDR